MKISFCAPRGRMDSAIAAESILLSVPKGWGNLLSKCFFICLILLTWRMFYHIFSKKISHDNISRAIKKDFAGLYEYVREIFLANAKTIRAAFAIMAALLVIGQIPYQVEVIYVIYDALAMLMYFLLVLVFAPKETDSEKGFPIEIFGFIYAVIFMFYRSGSLVFDIFYINDFFKEDMWIYGYIITIISYVVCIATLRGFMERKLSNEGIVLLGMIMLTTLEFITYYGIGFFSGIEYYDMAAYYADTDFFKNITETVNHGIYVASQSEVLERNSMEIWGNIILNGTDVLTITAVLGYVMQKFMEM